MTQSTDDTEAFADTGKTRQDDGDTEFGHVPYALAASPLLTGGPAPGGGMTGGPGIGATWLALGGPQAGGTRDSTDARTAPAVESALEDEPMLDDATIGRVEILVHGTVVELQGEVPASSDRDIAERTAARVPGVSAVHNHLRIADEA